jgi:hypothetical protein
VYVCTLRLAQALDVSVLMIVPRVFVYVALAAWLLTNLQPLTSNL